MRLILDIVPRSDIDFMHFLKKYHYSFRSLIMNLFSDYDSDNKFLKNLHDSKEYKPFCYGNIFPLPKDNILKEGNLYHISISSPIPEFIEFIFFKLKDKELLNIGDGSFDLRNISIKFISINDKSTIESVNVISLTENTDGKIKPILFHKNKDLFLKRLKRNLIRKYNYFNDDKICEDFDLFNNIKVELKNNKKPSFSIPIPKPHKEVNGKHIKEFHIIGSNLKFLIGNISEQQKKILNFVLDLGFGEKNSYGIGFMIRGYQNV